MSDEEDNDFDQDNKRLSLHVEERMGSFMKRKRVIKRKRRFLFQKKFQVFLFHLKVLIVFLIIETFLLYC